MDEERNSMNSDAREIVLRYEPQAQEVVERYVQPTRLPGKKDEQAQLPVRPQRRKKRGRRIFFACFGLLLLCAAGILIAWNQGLFDIYRPEDSFAYPLPGNSTGDITAKTAIPLYRNGDGTRLRYQETHGEQLSIQQVYEKVNPSTVTVMTVLTGGSGYIGTGVIFTDNGYILTNAHVIVGGIECGVVLDTGEYYPAQLVGLDKEKDLAVLKVDGKDLPAAEFGDSDALSVGDTVYAIGNPLGVELRGTLTDGIVSAINRDVSVDDTTMTLIQTNAALNNGNSGGPLINVYGQVVGINTMKMGSSSTSSVEGLGFAIPISSSAYMIDDLIAFGEIHGEAVIGISVLAEGVVLPSGETAVEVNEVISGGAGEKAGLQAGDYLLTADGEALTNSGDLIRIRRRYDVGDTLTVTVERNGERFETKIILSEGGQ